MTLNNVGQQWLGRVANTSANRKRRRPRASFSSMRAAEMLESRALLSASGGHAAASLLIHPQDHHGNGGSHQGTQLAFQSQPADVQAGQSFSVSVAIEDASGNVLTTINANVRLRVRGSGHGDGGSQLNAAAVNGIATFNVSLTRAGSYTLQADAGHCGQVRSNSFTVSADTTDPEQLVFARRDPHAGAVGQALKTVTVAVEDKFGNIVTSDNSSITLGINSGPTLTFDSSVPSPDTVAVQNGFAQFNGIILDMAGAFTLSATDSNSAIGAGTSGPLIIHALDQQGQDDHGHGHDD